MLASSESVDPSPHIPLIHRVINQMGISGSDKEEAFSEGLVAITVAAQKFNPEKQVPLANWLAKNIRWSLLNWRDEQRRRTTLEAPTEVSQAVVHNVFDSAQVSSLGASTLKYIGLLNQASVAHLENHLALKEAWEKIDEILTPMERKVLILVALELPGIEIAAYLGITTVAVSRHKKKAQGKMREALL